MQMPLTRENYEKNYYRQRFSLDQAPPSDLLTSFASFENAGLKVSPTDLIKILFNCKLLFASKTEQEFGQRRGNLSLFWRIRHTSYGGQRRPRISMSS